MKVLRLFWRILVVLCQALLQLWHKYQEYRALKAQQSQETAETALSETSISEAAISEAAISETAISASAAHEVEEAAQTQILMEPLPEPLVETADRQWIPPGTAVQVQDILIADGLIYLGQSGADPHGTFVVDPSLKLKAPSPQKRQELLGIDWAEQGSLSYASLSPELRSIFLGWLATGRKDRELPMSALRLFLYGIEHRVVDLLSGDRTVEELLALILELERLEGHYAHHAAVIPEVKRLIECCQIQLALSCQPETLLALLPVGQKLSLALKVVLGRCIEQSKTIPMALLWAWYLSSSVVVDLKTPAKRCESAFNFLIQTRGEQRAFSLDAGESPVKLPVYYTSFGPDFGPDAEPIFILETIDISELEPQLTALEPLIEDCTNDLDAYSRLIGRSPELEGTPAAVALLPQELVFLSGNEQVTAIQTWCQDTLETQDFISISGDLLLSQWPTAVNGKIRKKEAELLGQFLAKFGFGYVPDVRYWQATVNPKHPVILFRLDQLGVEAPSEDYPVALMTLELSPFFENVDREALNLLLAERWELTASERSRLIAVRQWRDERPLTWKQACAKVKKLSQDEQFKLAVTITLQLEQAWQLDESRYTTLQSLIPLPERPVSKQDAIAPVSEPDVEAVEPEAPEIAPPLPEAPVAIEPPSEPIFILDTQLIAQRNQESQVASGLLSEIFEEDELAPTNPAAPVEPSESPNLSETSAVSEPSQSTCGLDQFHWDLLNQIGQKESWARAELEAIAQDQGLLLDGALENINDVAFDHCDEALTEGDDPIEVNDWVYEELQAA